MGEGRRRSKTKSTSHNPEETRQDRRKVPNKISQQKTPPTKEYFKKKVGTPTENRFFFPHKIQIQILRTT